MARILLADDDAGTRDLVSRALTADGHEVAIATDGLDALEQLKRAPAACDLLISDIEMPGLDGVGLLKAARAIAPGLRARLISGFEGSQIRADEVGGAAVRCIAKPFTLEKIRAEVRAALA
jgi:two-component system cell cycle sensor histidine kinase/response regulator CckA